MSSGAVAAGRAILPRADEPGAAMAARQALAALGQAQLIGLWQRFFERPVAQVLLTHDDLRNRRRYLNARATLNELLRLGALPVVNENDTVSVDELKLGDNDNLAATVAALVDADALFIATDIDGLYSADPRKDPDARFIDVCEAGDPALEQMAGGAGSRVGTGGMITKVLAAKRAARSGASTVIAWGREPDVLVRLSKGEPIGSLFVAGTAKFTARKQWMADHLQLRGVVVIDDGAVAKLRDEGKSLLPIGVVEVQGEFHRGDVVAVRNLAGHDVARGLASYASSEARLIARKPSSEIEGILGFIIEPALIHRDNLVLMD